MRLSIEERQIIKAATKEIFGEESTVLLFSSRINDDLKGGDIDLLIQSESVIDARQQKSLVLSKM